MPVGLGLKFDVVERDILPLNLRPKDRPWGDNRPFTIVIVVFESVFVEWCPPLLSGVPLKEESELLYLSGEPASTRSFNAISRK